MLTKQSSIFLKNIAFYGIPINIYKIIQEQGIDIHELDLKHKNGFILKQNGKSYILLNKSLVFKKKDL